LYVFARRLGHSAEDAEDLTQGFFARLLEKEYLKSTQPEKGKFRTFLLTAFKRFMATEWQRAGRLKRGGGQQVISMDAVDTENRYLAEPVDQMSPEKHFDKQWAIALLDRVMLNLQREAESAGKAELFAELKPSLTGEQDRASYLQVGERLAVSEGALRVAAHRLRQRYRDLLRQEIAQTLESAGDVDEEIRDLFASVT
jgi:RNA polymerase sigma-70 factor (ECF subfamily)